MSATKRMLLSAVTLLLLALAVSTGLAAHAAQREPLCFSQTGLCINGRFQDYWTQNGGLRLFGLPLTPTMMEHNSDSAQVHTT